MPKLSSRPACPRCSGILDGYTAMDLDSTPRPGDVSVCAICLAVLEFTDDLMLVEATVETIEDAGLLEVSEAVNAARRYRDAINLTKKS